MNQCSWVCMLCLSGNYCEYTVAECWRRGVLASQGHILNKILVRFLNLISGKSQEYILQGTNLKSGNNNTIIIVINTQFLLYVGRYYVTLLNSELVSRAKLCLFSVFPDIVKDCPKMRNLLKIFLRSFENVDPGLHRRHNYTLHTSIYCIWRNVAVIRLCSMWERRFRRCNSNLWIYSGCRTI